MTNYTLKGSIHSIESLGTVDGPGLRTVVFFQGCPLRCKFCHNIDCTETDGGKDYLVDELFEEVVKNKEYWGNNLNKVTGGVTCSGGEPTFQPDFLMEFLKNLKENKIHTSVDTCSVTSPKTLEKLLPYVDLWMMSIKHMDTQKHSELTGVYNERILQNIKLVDSLITKIKLKTKIRIRFLVIPTKTDSEEHINQLGEFVSKIKNLENLELLAYGTHGKYKWEKLYGKYQLKGVREADRDDLVKIKEILTQYINKILY